MRNPANHTGSGPAELGGLGPPHLDIGHIVRAPAARCVGARLQQRDLGVRGHSVPVEAPLGGVAASVVSGVPGPAAVGIANQCRNGRDGNPTGPWIWWAEFDTESAQML